MRKPLRAREFDLDEAQEQLGAPAGGGRRRTRSTAQQLEYERDTASRQRKHCATCPKQPATTPARSAR